MPSASTRSPRWVQAGTSSGPPTPSRGTRRRSTSPSCRTGGTSRRGPRTGHRRRRNAPTASGSGCSPSTSRRPSSPGAPRRWTRSSSGGNARSGPLQDASLDRVEILRASSAAAFLDLAGDFLAEREAEHNLIFGILSSYEADPSQYAEAPYLATVLHGDKVVGAAIRTPPWRIVLSEMDHPGAVHRLVQDLAGVAVPGAVGPSDAATHFAEAWSEARYPGTPRLVRHERAFRLHRVTPARPTTGVMVRAQPEHRRLVADWVGAFHEEALANGPPQD